MGCVSDVPSPGVWVSPALTIPDRELQWRFSRSSGPGGQGVNTTDSRAELSWSVDTSSCLTDEQRQRLLLRLGNRLVGGVLTIVASEFRSQLRNRDAARTRLATLIATDLAPPPPPRRPTKPSRGAQQRRIDSKKRRATVKQDRRRPTHD